MSAGETIVADLQRSAFYAQFKLNHGKPVGFSIPATEHSIMTAHQTEKDAMVSLLENFGSGVCACVMDSYDYKEALEKVLPSVASLAVKKGGFLVLRPDSGDPVEVVLMALRAADQIFGSNVNQKGYKVSLLLYHSRQGDSRSWCDTRRRNLLPHIKRHLDQSGRGGIFCPMCCIRHGWRIASKG